MTNKTEIKELRHFGVIVGGIFALIGLWPLVVYGTEARLWAIAVGALLVASAVVFPRVLQPIHRVWMFMGHWLGWINTRILLGILFYGIVTPMGMIRRLWVKDAMDLQFSENADSYRRVRQPRPGSHMWHPF